MGCFLMPSLELPLWYCVEHLDGPVAPRLIHGSSGSDFVHQKEKRMDLFRNWYTEEVNFLNQLGCCYSRNIQ